jgi:nickel-dependent lactate racemase
MRLDLAWGQHALAVEVEDRLVLTPHRAPLTPPVADPAAAVRDALEHPIDYPALRHALTPDDHVAVVVDEHLPQLPRLLVPVLEHLREAGIAPEAITLLCLPPSSGQPWLEELPDEFQDVRVEVHQPEDRKKLSYLATTKQGRRIYLNRSAVDADQLVLVTRRSYDPVLGYAGGETALYPGLSDEATLQEAGAKPDARPPGPEPWPTRKAAAEVAWLLGAPFLVQVIEWEADATAAVLAGPPESTTEGVRQLDARWRVEVDRPADVVIAPLSGTPDRLGMDDLARAFFSAARVVRPGGAIVVLTDAAPALGRSFELIRQREDPGAALKLLSQERPADLPAGFMWATAATQAKLYLLSGLPAETVEELFAVPLDQPRQVERLLKPDAAVLVLPDAHKTLAVLRP